MVIGFSLLAIELPLLFQIKFHLSIVNCNCIFILLGVIIHHKNKTEVGDEKNTINVFSCYFLDFFFGFGFGRSKNCPINHTRLFLMRQKRQDRFYPEKN